jgi:mannose-6-phosphate isomerase
LFKVLSIGKPLSIQAHPDKVLAERLHATWPQHYPDDNHKPEMAIALTPFEALCGFKPLENLVQAIKDVHELRDLIGQDVVERLLGGEPVLPLAFRNVMKAPIAAIHTAVTNLKERTQGRNMDPHTQLVLRLDVDFPGDVGCFSALFLNHLHLTPGQALFLAANEPHAYLSGDCMECMATSDNVVRAGLTPKFKDVDTLCSMLTYTTSAPLDKLLVPVRLSEHLNVYKPPVNEFSVLKLDLPHAMPQSIRLPGPSILLCVGGKGSAISSEVRISLEPGTMLFLDAGVDIICTATQHLECFIATTNSR